MGTGRRERGVSRGRPLCRRDVFVQPTTAGSGNFPVVCTSAGVRLDQEDAGTRGMWAIRVFARIMWRGKPGRLPGRLLGWGTVETRTEEIPPSRGGGFVFLWWTTAWTRPLQAYS